MWTWWTRHGNRTDPGTGTKITYAKISYPCAFMRTAWALPPPFKGSHGRQLKISSILRRDATAGLDAPLTREFAALLAFP